MVQDARKCSRCDGRLREGFLEDRGETASALRWIEGPLEKGIFGGAKVMFKDRYDVSAFRCEKCGHLDLFVLGTTRGDLGLQ